MSEQPIPSGGDWVRTSDTLRWLAEKTGDPYGEIEHVSQLLDDAMREPDE